MLVDPQGNEFSVSAPNAPSGLSRAVHIWRGLMKPKKPRGGHRGAAGRHGRRRRHGGRGPHGRAAGLSAALRPGAEPLRAQDVLGDADLLGARGGRGIARAAVGGPGGLLELQAAVRPLPVLVDQLPPDSHWAMASQFTVSALAVPVERAIGTTPSAPAMAVANRPLVTALRMFISAVLPRPFETRPAVRNLCVLPMRLSGVSGDEHHVLRECQKFYSLLNWCKRPLRKKRRCRAKARHRLCSGQVTSRACRRPATRRCPATAARSRRRGSAPRGWRVAASPCRRWRARCPW